MKYLLLAFALTFLLSFTTCEDVDETVNAFYKQNLTLDCTTGGIITFFREVTTDNDTKIEPIVNSDKVYIQDGRKLILQDIRGDTLKAKYFCKKEEKVVKRYHFNVAPYLYKPEKASQTVTEGGFIEIKCTVLFGAENSTIDWTWTKNGTDLSTDVDKYEIKKSNNQSSLIIKKVSKEDKGDFTCEAKNTVGEHSETIQLRVKDALAALWPFLAIVAEVIILCLIILIYEKKCAKKPSNNDEDNEQAQNLMGKDQPNSDLKKRGGK